MSEVEEVYPLVEEADSNKEATHKGGVYELLMKECCYKCSGRSRLSNIKSFTAPVRGPSEGIYEQTLGVQFLLRKFNVIIAVLSVERLWSKCLDISLSR